MKTFLKNSILFCLIVILIIGLGLVLPNNISPRSIDYSIITKHQQLKRIKKPKIILTGGSNVLFGYNSKIISDSLQLPVVNNAIHAGYGLKYILDDVLPFISERDIIILSPEYSHFFDDNMLGNEPLLFSLTAMPKNVKLLSINQWLHIVSYIPKFSFQRIKSFVYSLLVNNSRTDDIYNEFSINQYGDNNAHWKFKKIDFLPYMFKGEFNYTTIKLLKEFQNKVKKKRAFFYIAYPSLCESSFKINKNRIELVKNKLETNSFFILGTPKDFMYHDDYFFDTPYHLNGKGVTKRSLKLIDLLKKRE